MHEEIPPVLLCGSPYPIFWSFSLFIFFWKAGDWFCLHSRGLDTRVFVMRGLFEAL